MKLPERVDMLYLFCCVYKYLWLGVTGHPRQTKDKLICAVSHLFNTISTRGYTRVSPESDNVVYLQGLI